MTAHPVTVIAQVLGLSAQQLQLDDGPETIPQWDSLAHVNLMLALESEYDVMFSPQEMASMSSVRSIQDALMQKGVPVALAD